MSKRVPTPQETIKIRGREVKIGDEIMVPGKVTRIGRNTQGTATAVTIELRIGQKVTGNPDYMFGDAED